MERRNHFKLIDLGTELAQWTLTVFEFEMELPSMIKKVANIHHVTEQFFCHGEYFTIIIKIIIMFGYYRTLPPLNPKI